MLKGFEEQTEELTDYEVKLLPGFVSSFSKRKGKENAITNKEIIAAYSKGGVKLSDSRVRKIINYIRMNCLVEGLMASSSGYYVTDNYVEIDIYIESLSGRIEAISRIKEKFQTYSEKIKPGL